MKFTFSFGILFFATIFGGFAQGSLEDYKKQQNAEFAKFKQDYANDLKKIDALYQNYLQNEREMYRVFSNYGYIPEKVQNQANAVEKMYPKLATKIPLDESLKTLTLIERKWEEEKAEINSNPKAQNIDVPDELIPLENEDELQVVDIVKNVEIKPIKDASQLSKELKLEIEANRPVYCPLPKNTYRLSSPFNKNRLHPILKIVRKHEGIDLAAPEGTKIYATANGVVSISKYSRSAGKYVVVNHQNGYTTSYMHMSKMLVNTGDKVKRGQLIGYVGSTGISTGNHIHYEVRKNGDAYDPAPFIKNHF